MCSPSFLRFCTRIYQAAEFFPLLVAEPIGFQQVCDEPLSRPIEDQIDQFPDQARGGVLARGLRRVCQAAFAHQQAVSWIENPMAPRHGVRENGGVAAFRKIQDVNLTSKGGVPSVTSACW